MRLLCATVMVLLLSCAAPAQQNPSQTPSPTPTPAPQPPSAWSRLLSVLGISATPRSQKDVERSGVTGKIVVARLDAGFEPLGQRDITDAGGFRWPVFLPGGEQVLALRGDTIVRVSVQQRTVEDVAEVKGVIKLVGVNADKPDEVLLLFDADRDNCPVVGLFSITNKQLTPVPYGRTDLDDAWINTLMGSERTYPKEGVTLVEVEERLRESPRESWFNVYLRIGAREVNISGCEKVKCLQPSFVNPPRMVAYIREQ